jgi:hypothetical protein
MGQSVTEVVAKKTEIGPFDTLEVEKHVQRVAQSAQFTRAETLKRLLLYLWVHRDEDISEYAVATDALGRRVDFDPKTDASARVQISRLRRKLKDYYEGEGSGEAYMLHIPIGTHSLTILNGSSQSLSPAISPPEESPFPARHLVEPSLNFFALLFFCSALGSYGTATRRENLRNAP